MQTCSIESGPRDRDEIRASADILELDGITEDDPFVLLTALHLGPGARILSNDVMRQHHNALSSSTENGCVWIHGNCYGIV